MRAGPIAAALAVCLAGSGAVAHDPHAAPIRDLAADRAGRWLATASDEGTVRIWEVASGRVVRALRPAAAGRLRAVALSPDGATVAFGGVAGARSRDDQGGHTYFDLYVHDVDSGRRRHTLAVPFPVEGLAYSPDGAHLVASSRAFGSTSTDFGADRVFATPDYRWARDAFPTAGAALAFADFDARGRLLLVQKFGTWVVALQGRETPESRELPGIPVAVRPSPDGARLAIAFADATLGVYSGDDLSLLYRPEVAGIGPAAVAFTEAMDLAETSRGTVDWSADGSALHYSGGRSCSVDACAIRTWTEAGRGPYRDVVVAASRVTRLVALPDGTVAYASVGPALGVVDAEGRRRSFFADREPAAGAAGPTTAAPPAAAAAAEPADAELVRLHATVADQVRQGRFREALAAARSAAERAGDADGPDALQARLDLAHVAHAVGDVRRVAGESPLVIAEYRDASSSYGRVATALERRGAAEHDALATVLEDLGRLRRAMRRYDQAADAFQQALALRQAGVEETQTVRAGVELATTRAAKLVAERRIVDAFAAAHGAVEAAEGALAAGDGALAHALGGLAEVHRAFRASWGDVAVRLHERALAIHRRAGPRGDGDVAASLRALGDVHAARGRAAEAERAYAEALALVRRVLGEGDPAVATLMTTVAGLQASLGRTAEAEALYRRVLAIREQEGEAYRIAGALEDLGDLRCAAGRPTDAVPLYERALALRDQHQGASHFKVAETARRLGTAHRSHGDAARARPLYARAMAIHGDGTGNVALPWALRDAAALAAAEGDDGRALALLDRSLAAQEPIFRVLFRPDREERQLESVESPHVSGGYWFFLTLVAGRFRDDGRVVRAAADLAFRRKALAYDLQSRVTAGMRGLSADGLRVRDELGACRAELSALLLHKPRALPEAAYRDRVALRFERCAELERRLAALADPSAAYEPPGEAVTAAAVAAALPPRSALVEIVRIPDVDWAREDFDFPRARWGAAWRYLAFVLRPSGALRLVDLGPAAPVDAAVERVLRDVHEPAAGAWRAHLQALHARVWAPLGVPDDVEQVLVGPDGPLALAPFAALVDADGRSVLDRWEVAYVTSGRDLLAKPTAPPASAVLVVGDPAFDADPGGGANGEDPFRSRTAVGRFERLAGTAREAADVARAVGGERTVLLGGEATEAAVKAARPPRILHLATHGFFLDSPTLGMPAAAYETPLVRSGLALAGANRAAQATDGDDGLLTALEISALDLAATELVVLSACDTGVGEVRSGEGVFGLRRAFALAGARTLLMSLWRVRDDLAAEQIQRFYGHLRTMPPAAALREAQRGTRERLRAAGDADPPPALWAPFVVQGGGAMEARIGEGG